MLRCTVRALWLVLLLGCSDYGVFGKAEPNPDTDAPTAGDGGLGDGGQDGGATGSTPTDDETETLTEPPPLVDCTKLGLWTDQWWGSMPFTSAEAPLDSVGRPYTALDYEQRDFSTVSVPDEGHIPAGSDKVYRVWLWLDATGPRVFLDLQSDDGLWVALNEAEVGHWGGDWQQEGCVNDRARCTEYEEVGPVEITDRLVVGGNLLAVRVSNAVDNAYMGVSARCAEGE